MKLRSLETVCMNKITNKYSKNHYEVWAADYTLTVTVRLMYSNGLYERNGFYGQFN
jgi:hypothetical protein